jgi:hypothetical protein
MNQCKEMGPYTVDLPFHFGHFILLAVLVGIGMGIVFGIVLEKAKNYKEDSRG